MHTLTPDACPGGPKGPGPPPLEIENQKKSSEQILSYFTYILLLFQSEMSFSPLFSELGPPLEKLKSQKKAFQILPPPPLQIPGHATGHLDTSTIPTVKVCIAIIMKKN